MYQSKCIAQEKVRAATPHHAPPGFAHPCCARQMALGAQARTGCTHLWPSAAATQLATHSTAGNWGFLGGGVHVSVCAV